MKFTNKKMQGLFKCELLFLISMFSFVAADNSVSNRQISQDSTLVNIINGKSSLIRFDLWAIRNNYVGKFTEKDSLGLSITIAQFYENEADAKRKLVGEFVLEGLLVYALPINGNHIVVVYEKGNGIVINAFVPASDIFKMKRVFENESENYPEFADLNNDGKLEMLISNGRFLTSKGKIVRTPYQTNIYQWDGKSYVFLKKVPWDKRFCSQ